MGNCPLSIRQDETELEGLARSHRQGRPSQDLTRKTFHSSQTLPSEPIPQIRNKQFPQAVSCRGAQPQCPEGSASPGANGVHAPVFCFSTPGMWSGPEAAGAPGLLSCPRNSRSSPAPGTWLPKPPNTLCCSGPAQSHPWLPGDSHGLLNTLSAFTVAVPLPLKPWAGRGALSGMGSPQSVQWARDTGPEHESPGQLRTARPRGPPPQTGCS